MRPQTTIDKDPGTHLARETWTYDTAVISQSSIALHKVSTSILLCRDRVRGEIQETIPAPFGAFSKQS